MLDITEGLIELVSDISFDPTKADWFDANEYLDDIPNPRTVLKEIMHWVHNEYL